MTEAENFLIRHGMNPELISPVKCAEQMKENMVAGLNGNVVDMPMIPAFLSNEGAVPEGVPAIVIDAGGTNYRCALATFRNGSCEVEQLKVSAMPGTEKPCSWDEFISFVADSVESLAQYSNLIGFCFSYNAEITPEMDAIVVSLDKEVVVEGCNGSLLGESINRELERRGIQRKKIIILNDTVAALLGGSAMLDKSRYSDLIGMICGTGANTCCSVSKSLIGKLAGLKKDTMLINLESGVYSMFPSGDIDALLNAQSLVPGDKMMEKMCSGAYVGTLCRLALEAAEEEGCISAGTKARMDAIEKLNGAVADEWACGEDKYSTFATEADRQFAEELCLAVFERSARCMATNIYAIMLLNGSGTDESRPACVCAEGSLISRSRHFRTFLERELQNIAEQEQRYAVIAVGKDTTLPGSAAAVLLNT